MFISLAHGVCAYVYMCVCVCVCVFCLSLPAFPLPLFIDQPVEKRSHTLFLSPPRVPLSAARTHPLFQDAVNLRRLVKVKLPEHGRGGAEPATARRSERERERERERRQEERDQANLS